MRKTMIIPTYWCRRTGELWQEGDAVYDHPTPVDQEGTLERTLLSMKQFHEKDFKLVILICPTTPEVEEEAYGQVLRITRRAQLNAETYLFTAGDLREMTDILHTTGLTDQGAKLLSMFGYSNVRNICLLAASILTADAALLIDDDEVFELPDFVPRSLEFLGRRVYGDIVHGVAGYWQGSSILYILHNEKYAGDCLLQKTYTAQELPRFRKRNLGKYRQVFVKQSHPAIIEREKFERVQELLKRKRIAFAGDSVSTPFSKKIKCAECGSTFRLKKVRGKNYWTCMAHEKDVHKCSMLPLPEEQVLQAFLRLYYKLKYYGIGVLTQLISDFHAAKTGSLLWSENIVEINKQISDIASQERLLTQLKQQGSVDPDIFISRGNLLAERRRELKLQKERILRSEEDHTIQQTQDLLDVLESGPDWLDDFDEQLFSDLVEKIVVVDNEKLRFRLLNGLEVTEKIERTQR